jgi:hypothetical protein
MDYALTALARITYLYYHGKERTVARLPKLAAFQHRIIEVLYLSLPKQAVVLCRQQTNQR